MVFVVYLAGVGYGTFGPDPGAGVDRVAQSVKGVGSRDRDRAQPTARLEAETDSEWFGFVDAEDLANVAMFVPFGVLFPLVFPPWRRGTVPAGVALSGFIELVQLTVLTHRSPQWNDMWWNGVGTVIGFAALVVVQRLWLGGLPSGAR